MSRTSDAWIEILNTMTNTDQGLIMSHKNITFSGPSYGEEYHDDVAIADIRILIGQHVIGHLKQTVVDNPSAWWCELNYTAFNYPSELRVIADELERLNGGVECELR